MRKRTLIQGAIVGAVVVLLFFSPKSSDVKSPEEFDIAESRAALALNVPIPPSPEQAVFPETEKKEEVKSSGTAVDCAGEKAADFYCYEELYENIVKKDGIPAAFADLKARYAKNNYVRSQCHPLTHVIGRVAAQSYDSVAEAYKHGDGYCWSGYYHGILETFLGEIGLENLPRHIDSVCKDLNADGKYSFDYYNCVHGLGHGVMAVTNTELFKSLDECRQMTGWWEQQSCASGVYMENVIVDGLNHVTKYLDPKRPLYPCDESPEEFKNTCYMMQTSYMLKINGSDFKKTFEQCREATGYVDTCHQSLGRDASGRSTSNAITTFNTCALGGDDKEVSNCMIGAVKDFISYFHSDSQAREYCALYKDDLNKLCLETVDSYYATF